ncbi:unnamed protein product [Cladocopium goreaui]|uniref:PKS-NRPS hybrid synthetase swnK (Swainsonin e biosynthesis gene cluster protein K) n=1 Tax=Cladocopium goreaui TaxID=2562237 RepID=A0A9P1C2A1_9DINO|nr:unnamed protein product [Cladocopium goreaui]
MGHQAVFLPKCLGAWNLHRLTLTDDLEAMWFFSSLSGGVGTEGLYNYASANTYLDELARMRRSMALPAVSIQFPEVEEAGMAAAYVRSGAATVSLAVVREALQQLLTQPSSPVVALIPSGYLIPRSVYHWLALQPLEARRNKDLWKQMERIEKENKEDTAESVKELGTDGEERPAPGKCGSQRPAPARGGHSRLRAPHPSAEPPRGQHASAPSGPLAPMRQYIQPPWTGT